jgi:hypothetical protein
MGRDIRSIPFSEFEVRDIGTKLHLVGVVYSDLHSGEDLVLYLDSPPVSVEAYRVLEPSHEEWLGILRQSDLTETEVIAQARDGSLLKAVLRKTARQIDAKVAWRVYRRDNFRCRYCGTEDAPLTVDHAITWESGGPSIEDNLVSACKKCNNTRGTIPFDQWLEHPRYAASSANLTPNERFENLQLADRLHKIPRRLHRLSR